MAGAERVTVEITDGVADVRLNRPDKMNALDQAMFAGLVEASDRLAADPGVRAVVLSGEGRGFCAGLDLSSFQAMRTRGDQGAPGGTTTLADRPRDKKANFAQQAAYGWTELPVPVIAAVHGHALGGGFQIALAADIRIVAPDVKMSVLEIRWGLVPDMTATQMLPKLVPLDVAKELLWTGRTISGEEAVRLGIATRVSDDPRTTALELAAEIASKNPDAIRAGKRLLNQSGTVDAARQFLDESKEMGALIASPNQLEAMTAFLEKRDAVFSDPG
ncbi:MAG: crotonase/enoyl-CoA hydratase family protein [Acidimicrobiales bacterium]